MGRWIIETAHYEAKTALFYNNEVNYSAYTTGTIYQDILREKERYF